MDHRPGLTPPGPDPAEAGARPFAEDDGSVPQAVAGVLARRGRGHAGIGEVVRVLGQHRLLVPLLEVDADLLEGDDADPCAGQDRAVAAVSMRTDDGPVGLAFTGMAPLLAWRADARPMPVEATRVAQALLAEGGVALLVDPAGPVTVGVTGTALQRLATGEDWPVPWQDPVIRAAVVAELGPALASGDLAVRLAGPRGGAGDPGAPGLVVEVRFPESLPAEQAQDRAAAVAGRLRACGPLREVFDGTLAVRIV